MCSRPVRAELPSLPKLGKISAAQGGSILVVSGGCTPTVRVIFFYVMGLLLISVHMAGCQSGDTSATSLSDNWVVGALISIGL